MASTLVTTKLHVPQPRSTLVPRSRLTSSLDAGAGATLTLVAAPAGFGKTTVLATWLARTSTTPRTVAWVSLDQDDSQATSFWLYVVTALNTAAPGIGASVLPLLAAGQPATRTLLTAVLNDVGDHPTEVDLVLDDYHLADGTEVAEGMTFLLDNRPANLHVVISTRADPNLPLSRLRARGELVEIRARDLRFTTEETATYLGDISGLELAPEELSSLESRTEGWAAALQLAVLSMRGRDDVAGFIAGFAGTDRYVVDYLVDEVLSSQPEQVRDFLTRTSVLDLLGADLCDAVLEQAGSRAMLETLERANLFLVPLDDQRQWYRYHHLLADVLQAHLRDAHPELVPLLHLRASRWYDRAGEPIPAVRHALAAGDLDQAADLVETAIPGLQRDRQEVTIRRWLEVFPDEVVRTRPVLAVAFIGALMSCNEFARVESRLRDVEEQVPVISARLASHPGAEARGTGPIVAVDDAELARVPSAVELYRAGLSLVTGNLPATHRHAQRAIDTSTPADDVVRAGASGLSALAHWASGELDEAHRCYTTCIDGLLRAQHVSDVLGCSIAVADIRMAQGRLRDAEAVYDEALRLATGNGGAGLRGAADMHVGRSQVALERGELDTAREHLATARALGEQRGLPQYPYRSRLVAATLSETDGDLATALDLLEEAQQVYLGDFSPNVRPLHAVIARLHLRLGDLDAAERWARDHDLAPSQDLSYLREFEHVTLAELLLAHQRRHGDQDALVDAHALLHRLLRAADAGGRTTRVIDVLVLQALAADASGDADTALVRLERAVRLAEQEGQVRAFARHGRLLAPLLGVMGEQAGSFPFVRTLLAVCRTPAEDASRAETPPSPAAPVSAGLVEPLSGRELQVLHLLATDLDGPDIARQLFVSLNTVRTHTKNIYAKLDVNNRRAAVRRGRELGLLTL